MLCQFVILDSVEMKHSFMLLDRSVFVGMHRYTLTLSVNWNKVFMTRQNQLWPSGAMTLVVSAFAPINEAYLYIQYQSVFSLY